MADFITMRRNMVQGQIEPENVTNPFLIDALLSIPREKFVPHQLARIAYMDTNFTLGRGRFLTRPATLARLLQALNPKSSDKILYIAGGTGYGPALLSKLTSHITALDCEETLTQEAERLVNELKLSSIEIALGPLHEGWERNAPYDKILIEGGVDFVPINLISQLKEGGCLVTIKYQKEKGKAAIKIDKKQKIATEVFLFDAFVPRLGTFHAQKAFVF